MSDPIQEPRLDLPSSDFLSLEEVKPLLADWYEMNPPITVPSSYGDVICPICGARNYGCREFLNWKR